jgi:son of sevenless
VWSAVSTESCSHSSYLSPSSIHQPFVLSPEMFDRPVFAGTRTKGLSSMPTKEPKDSSGGVSLLSSPGRQMERASFTMHSHTNFGRSRASTDSSAQEIVWHPTELTKICPSSPLAPPPPTPESAHLNRDPLPEDGTYPVLTAHSTPDVSPATCPDSYVFCHPKCAHRRVVRLPDGLYFRPLSVLLETASIDSLKEEDSDGSIVDDVTTRSNSLPRRLDKIKQITGDDVAQAVHAARIARASQPWYLQPSINQEEIIFDHDGTVVSGSLSALVETLVSEPLRKYL